MMRFDFGISMWSQKPVITEIATRFPVSLEVAIRLAPRIPEGVLAVAESGIRTGADVKRLREAGYGAFLVGEHLMQAPDPGSAVAALIREGGTS